MNRKRTEIGREAFERAKAVFEKMKTCTDEKQLDELRKEYDRNMVMAQENFLRKASLKNGEGQYWLAMMSLFRVENGSLVYIESAHEDLRKARRRGYKPAGEKLIEFRDSYMPLLEKVHQLKEQFMRDDGSPDVGKMAEALKLNEAEVCALLMVESEYFITDMVGFLDLVDDDLPF